MGAMFDYLDAEEGGAEDMIKHALGEVIELNDKICGSPGGPEKIELAARAGLQAATVLLYVYGHAHEEERNWWDRRRPWDESDTCRPVSIAESQPALKVSFNRPRPRSQPARAGGPGRRARGCPACLFGRLE